MKRVGKAIYLVWVMLFLGVTACSPVPTSSTPLTEEKGAVLPDCYEQGYAEYLRTEKDFWLYSDFDTHSDLPKIDEACYIPLGQSAYGYLLRDTEKNGLFGMDRTGEVVMISDIREEIVTTWVSDPVFYVAFSRSVWRGTFDGLWEKIYEIPEDENYYTVSNIYPISTADVRIDLLDHRVAQKTDWYGTGDGYTYKCAIYSTLTQQMYEIPDSISPNLVGYLSARFEDILASGRDPYALCCQDLSIYKKYSGMENIT